MLALGRSTHGAPGVERPCSAGTWSERVEAVGATGAFYLDACGRLGRRDERARQALQYTPRSLVSAPAVHHRVSRWRRTCRRWGRIAESLSWQSKRNAEPCRLAPVERK